MQQLDLPGSLQNFLLAVSVQLLDNPGISNPARLATYCTQLQHATKAQLCAKRFWERSVEQGLLPALLTVAAASEAARKSESCSPESQQQQGDEEELNGVDTLALALRPCANLLCTSVHGCSEGRLRGRRCSGCGVVHYCSQECQLQHWAHHGQICAALAAMKPHA